MIEINNIDYSMIFEELDMMTQELEYRTKRVRRLVQDILERVQNRHITQDLNSSTSKDDNKYCIKDGKTD